VIPALTDTAAGQRTSMVLAPSGWPIISLINETDVTVDVLACGSASCHPQFRPGR
jgi:hypothetical protein